MRLTALLGPAGAILLAACYGAPGRYYAVRDPYAPLGAERADRDHDGALGPYECRGDRACEADLARLPPPSDLDCDDWNASVFPGAPEVDGDGRDANCDGADGWACAVPPVAAQPLGPARVASPPSGPARIATPPTVEPTAPARIATPPSAVTVEPERVPPVAAEPIAPEPAHVAVPPSPPAGPQGPSKIAAPPSPPAGPQGPSKIAAPSSP